ncbi:hypothetical protein IF1G_09974 [Cordyceps javanica]|uniref:Integral membrane protein n=1 Tax=Cordyceps javanica TaxID=43265 RepID=A0A545UPU0_9HYPO|nr:hypothetical protein IF1G_09974 [Cordyceps javanica]
MRPRGSDSRSPAPPVLHKSSLEHARGPVSFLNPTRGQLRPPPREMSSSHGDAVKAHAAGHEQATAAALLTKLLQPDDDLDGVRFLWRSRDNRKGRHPLRVQRRPHSQVAAPRRSSHPREVLRGIVRTFTQFPVWDISWLVAFIFTCGSVVWVVNLGFLAGAAQLLGATVFGVAGVTALPGVAGRLTPQWRLNAAYWIPQVVGGCGFIASGLLYMLETQERWWKPAPRLLGWHIAFWNLIGAFGFTLCGALGMAYGSSGAQYQAALATFWGSWAFLIGSYLQLYESLNKHPVEEVKATAVERAPP